MILGNPKTREETSMVKGTGKGWLRRKKGATLFCWRNADAVERSRVIGSAKMDDKTAWAKIGELGLDKQIADTDSCSVTFGELAEKYLTKYPFKKQSTKDLYEQVIRNVLIPKWTDAVGLNIKASELKSWLLSLGVSDCTRGKYRARMSHIYEWAKSEELIPEFVQGTNGIISSNPCTRVKGPEFSQESDYEALTLEVEDTFKLLSEIKGKNGEYEIALLVATCGFRISEALGLRWRDIVWDKGYARIRQTYVHATLQEGAKTRLSRSRVEVPHLALSVLAAWKRESMYSAEDDFVFPSIKLAGKKPRTGTMLVQDYVRPAAIRAHILIEKKSELFSKEGDRLSRFGFHNLGRHSLASFLMDEQANPAVVQAIMRHSQMDMTLYYAHSSKKQKRAALDNYAQHIVPAQTLRVPLRVPASA
jgi:integrase